MPPTHLVEDVVFVFESAVSAPVLPRFDPTEPRTSRGNVATANTRSSLFATFKRDRLREQQWLSDKISNEDGRVLRQTVLGSVMVADVTIETLRAVDEDVRLGAIGTASLATAMPTVAAGPGRSLLDARQQIRADGLHSWGYDGSPYYIGVIDTGVSDHDILVDKVAARQDCTQSVGGSCSGGDPMDCTLGDPDGHGTSVAAIAAANTAYGPEDRGYSDGNVHAWKVFEESAKNGQCVIPAGAPGTALDIAVLTDEVINISIATNPMADAALELAWENSANEAYAMGAMVIAGAGNSNAGLAAVPPPNTGAPGNADNVIAVGAVEDDGTLAEYSSIGPAADGRLKPDILAPTDIVTACATSMTCGGTFSGTSAATPNASGAAVQLLDLYDKVSEASSPPTVVAGRIYASLIAFGTRLDGGSGLPNDSEGSGLLKLGNPVCARWRWGSASIGVGESMTTEMLLNQGGLNSRIGIWWSDNPSGFAWDPGHVAMALRLTKSGGATYESALSNSTFQRLTLPELSAGTWTMEIEWDGGPPTAGTNRLVHFLWYPLVRRAASDRVWSFRGMSR